MIDDFAGEAAAVINSFIPPLPFSAAKLTQKLQGLVYDLVNMIKCYQSAVGTLYGLH
jgi:hypothetical protein